MTLIFPSLYPLFILNVIFGNLSISMLVVSLNLNDEFYQSTYEFSCTGKPKSASWYFTEQDLLSATLFFPKRRILNSQAVSEVKTSSCNSRGFKKITILTLTEGIYIVLNFQRLKINWTIHWPGVTKPGEVCPLIISWQVNKIKGASLFWKTSTNLSAK